MTDTVLLLHTRLCDHIRAVHADASTPLDRRVFDEAELVLVEGLTAEQRRALVVDLATLLPQLHQDARPVVDLLLRLVHDFSYANVLEVLDRANLSFAPGLAVGPHMSPFNRVILALLHKATYNAADAASVAGPLDTMLALVQLWLWTEDVGIAGQCSKLLLALLKVDQDFQPHDPDAHIPAGGQGLVWKRLFGDRDVYAVFFQVCSATGPSRVKASRTQRTLAQARLMEWLPVVGDMDWNAVAKSHHPEVEASFGLPPGAGLLDFAALHMVDFHDDVLMHINLIDFYSHLLRIHDHGLLYLVGQGLHTRTAAIYLQLPGAELDSVDASFLYGPAANYLATYASHHPDHFLASQLPPQIFLRLRYAFEREAGEWAHANSPKHDLHLLASLPKISLLGTSPTSFPSSPLSLLPTRFTHPDVLRTLATLFHGPPTPEILIDTTSNSTSTTSSTFQSRRRYEEEATAARSLYFQYLAHNPTLWCHMATHADTLALPDLALAAINLFHAIITSNWSSSSSHLPTHLPTPTRGHMAILSAPAVEYTIPYLLQPAPSVSHLVGGGRGDTGAAPYVIAGAKFECVKLLLRRMEGEGEGAHGEWFEKILEQVRRRVAQGILGREGGDVGARLAIL